MSKKKESNLMIRLLVVMCTLYFHMAIADDNEHEEQKTVQIANGEWLPYTSKTLENYGFFSDIVKQAFLSQGYTVQFEFLPWSRGFVETEKGNYDASVTWSLKNEWKDKFFFSKTVTESQKVLFYRHQNPVSWETYEDLVNTRIGILNGFTYGSEFDNFVKRHPENIVRLQRDEQAIKMLAIGRIDAFASDMTVGYNNIIEYLAAPHNQLITHHPKRLDSTSLHVIFSKNLKNGRGKILQEAFNKGLHKIKENGTLEQIELRSVTL